MAAIITEKFRLHNTDQFYESFSETSASTYYFFIGKHSPYIDADNFGFSASDNVPPPPVDDVQVEAHAWDSMLAAKKISTADVSYVIPRVDWKVNTVFDMYEHDVRPAQGTDTVGNVADNGSTSLWGSSFYFMTEDYRVYKVLDNNSGSQIPNTTSKPTSEESAAFFLGGYLIKYMYTMTTSQVEKFLTSDFMPVATDSSVSSNANNTPGKIEVIRVTEGSGYTNAAAQDGFTVYSPIRGDGSGGVVKIVVYAGAIQKFGTAGVNGNSEVQTAGLNYTYATVNLSDVYTDTALTTATSITGSNGKIEPIIPPRVGHGFNAIEELGGHFIMMNAKLNQAEGDDLTVANDFRQIGIMVDPAKFGQSAVVATDITQRQTYAILFGSAPTANYIIDEKITQSSTGAVGRVVEWNETKKILYYVQERHSGYGVNANSDYVGFSGTGAIVGDTIANGGSGASGIPNTSSSQVSIDLPNGNTIIFDTSGYCNPELEPDSGNIIYIENRRPISRAPDQSEDIKIIIEF